MPDTSIEISDLDAPVLEPFDMSNRRWVARVSTVSLSVGSLTTAVLFAWHDNVPGVVASLTPLAAVVAAIATGLFGKETKNE
jgi:hypothetical protein